MGVRLREYLQAQRGSRRAVSLPSSATQIEGFKEFEKRLAKLGDFPKDMYKELRAENHRIGRVAARVIKRKLPSQGTEFVMYKRRAKGIQRDGKAEIIRTIPAGTLRRSIRTWNSKGSKINVQVGPRGRRGSIRYDGFFAGIVEGGHTGGRNRSTGSKFYNKIRPVLKSLEPRMRKIQLVGYRRIYHKWVTKL
jgi:hypothetical protein